MKTITRLGFFGAISAAVSSLFAQTTITACAPVLYQMPKPCEGQCPACGLAHGIADLAFLQSGSYRVRVTGGERGVKFICTHCRNLFFRPVAKDVSDQYREWRYRRDDDEETAIVHGRRRRNP